MIGASIGHEIETEIPSRSHSNGPVVPPIFVVGPSRSGSTLLSRMLDSHSAVAMLPESWCFAHLDALNCFHGFSDKWQYMLFLNRLWHNLQAYKDPAAGVLAGLAAEQPVYVGPASAILERLGGAYAARRGARIWGEKTPAHSLLLPQICELFPQARVVMIVRDPRDIVVSYDDYWGGSRRDTNYMMMAAATVRRNLSSVLANQTAACHRILVRYETLVTDPQSSLQQVCNFLGLDFEPCMLEYHLSDARETSIGNHHRLLAKPPTAQQIGRYRESMTPEQVDLIEEFMGAEMKALGYPVDGSKKRSDDPASQDAKRQAQRRYARMSSGVFRGRARRHAKTARWLLKFSAPVLRHVPSSRFALTPRQWRARMGVSPGQPVGRRFFRLSEFK